MVAASHLLSYVEEQGIVALFLDGERRPVDILFTDLLSATLRGGDIDDLSVCRPLVLLTSESHTCRTRVKLRESIVIP